MPASKSGLSLFVLILTVLLYSATGLAVIERWWEKQEEGWFFIVKSLKLSRIKCRRPSRFTLTLLSLVSVRS